MDRRSRSRGVDPGRIDRLAELGELEIRYSSAASFVVKRRRGSLAWSQAELAYRAGLSPSEIQHIEHGRRNPGLGTLLRICDAFGISLMELLAEITRVEQERKWALVCGRQGR